MDKDSVVEIREFFNITQSKFSLLLGVNKLTVGRYEKGKAKPVGDTLKKIKILQKFKKEFAKLIEEDNSMAAAAALLSMCSVLLNNAALDIVKLSDILKIRSFYVLKTFTAE